MSAVTDFIQTTESLMDFALARLSSYSGWSAAKHPGSSAKDVMKTIPELTLPAALLVYGASSYGDKPRRKASFSVIVAAEFESASGRSEARALLDKAIALLDGQISGMALFRAVSDSPVELGGCIAAYEIKFTVEDH